MAWPGISHKTARRASRQFCRDSCRSQVDSMAIRLMPKAIGLPVKFRSECLTMANFLYNWSRLKLLERIELTAICTAIPGIYLLDFLLERIGMSSMVHYIFPIWFAALFIFDIAAMNFNCPRCEGKFFYRTVFKNRFTSKCLHCGLPKWAEDGQSPQEYKRPADISNSNVGLD